MQEAAVGRKSDGCWVWLLQHSLHLSTTATCNRPMLITSTPAAHVPTQQTHPTLALHRPKPTLPAWPCSHTPAVPQGNLLHDLETGLSSPMFSGPFSCILFNPTRRVQANFIPWQPKPCIRVSSGLREKSMPALIPNTGRRASTTNKGTYGGAARNLMACFMRSTSVGWKSVLLMPVEVCFATSSLVKLNKSFLVIFSSM